MAEESGRQYGPILVVDDEPIILRFATSVFSYAGFQSLVAANGVEGFQMYVAHQQEISLVFTDIVMPGGGGFEMAQNILSVNPAARILMMSGYSNAAREMQARRKFPFIRKPFLREDLLRKIRQVLGA